MSPQLPAIPAIPAIHTCVQGLRPLYEQLQALLGRSSPPKFLSILRYVTYIVLLVNACSLPFVWHSEWSSCLPWARSRLNTRFLAVRVFWPLLARKIEHELRSRFIFIPKAERVRAVIAWAEGHSRVGATPFEAVTLYKSWASTSEGCTTQS
jgi:hypothetical protein